MSKKVPEGGNQEAGAPQREPYVPPAILWEQGFVALAQVSPPTCFPGDPPPCPGV